MNKKFYTSLLFLLLFGLAAYFFVWPAYQEAIQVKQDLSDWQEKLKTVNEGKGMVASLKSDYDNLKAEEDRILEAVPNKEDLPGLLVQLEAMASQNGLILSSLTFDLEKPTKAVQPVATDDSNINSLNNSGSVAIPTLTPIPVSSPIETLAVDAKLSGSYSALKNLLQAVEKNLRLADVTAVGYSQNSATESDSSETGSVAVGLNFYYKK